MTPVIRTLDATRQQERLLMEAALADSPDVLRDRWASWRAACPDLEGMTMEEYRLLAYVWTRLDRLGVEDPDAPRLRGIAKKAWFHNHHLLQEAAGIQSGFSERGVESLLFREAALLAAAFGQFGVRHTAAIDLIVRRSDLRAASRLLARHRPERGFGDRQITFRAEGRPAVHLQVAELLFPASSGKGRASAAIALFDGCRSVTHGARTYRLPDTEALLFLHLYLAFSQLPPGELSLAAWLPDFSAAAATCDPDPDRLMALIDDAGCVPLFRFHLNAAVAAAPSGLPPLLRRVWEKEPGPRQQGIDRALRAYADPGPGVSTVVRHAAWWLAQLGQDPRTASQVGKARYLGFRLGRLIRMCAASPRYLAHVLQHPGHYVGAARSLLTRP